MMAARTTERPSHLSVTRLHSARIAHRADLGVVPIEYRAEITRLLVAIDDADARTVEEVLHGLALIRARALGKPHHEVGIDHQHKDQEHHHPLAALILDAVSRDNDLVRVSLTVPQDNHDGLAPNLRAFAGEIAGTSASNGALLMLDLRPKDLAPHGYGIVSCSPDDRKTLAQRWCDLTGASPEAHEGPRAVQTIGGWRHFASTGNDASIRGHLSNVLGYGLRELPANITRDLDSDVVASGRLAAPWSVFRASGHPSATPSPCHGGKPMGVAVTLVVTCSECPAELDGRDDRATCGDTCRQRRKRRLKREAQR